MQQALDDLDALLERAQRELAALDDAALDRRPEDGGWTAREALDHVVRTVDLYLAKLDGLLARHPAPKAPRAGRGGPGVLGGLLLKALRKPGKRFQAPKAFRPAASPATTPGDFLAAHRRLREAARTIADRNLGGVKVATPISRLLRLPARAAIEAQVLHGARHLDQALAAAGRPTSGGSGA